MECHKSLILKHTKHKMKKVLMLAGALALSSFAADKFIISSIDSLQKDMARNARLDSVVVASAAAPAPTKKK
jgi:hypothetical protein